MPAQNPRPDHGISLYTLLAAVVVLGVLGSTLVTQFDGTNSKGQALFATAKNIGQAASRYHLDTTCYPSNISALFQYSSSGASNSCGAAIQESKWAGPYIKQYAIDSSGYAPIEQYGPGATVSVRYNSGSPEVVFRNVTGEIRNSVMDACGATNSNNTNCSIVNQNFVYDYAPDE